MPTVLGFLPIVRPAVLDCGFRQNLFGLGLLSSPHRAPCLVKLAGADWDGMPNCEQRSELEGPPFTRIAVWTDDARDTRPAGDIF